MYQLKVEQSFDAAHFLEGYDGKCKNIHGHRWRVVARVQSVELCGDVQRRGMCVDFATLKEDLAEILKRYDHMFIIEQGSLRERTMEALREEGFFLEAVPFRPTAENFARHFYELLAGKGYDVAEVEVYETPNNCASYRK